ncbi:hypothetical protein BCR34DRAFT_570183 [Clohesyomyces aquaticus]|uniref:Uncharacterized protein n=1 Tax=Clohesyomyces aquaticus TaxID=1231657 RepID=A0A1Y1ZCX8_9PLEO|nr:hypothetical protein BCR34DRAFT_570183 [Clohesyomyces aquaticus]
MHNIFQDGCGNSEPKVLRITSWDESTALVQEQILLFHGLDILIDREYDMTVQGGFQPAKQSLHLLLPFLMIVSLGAFAFYPNFFSNGTYGADSVANYESISSIIDAEYNSKTGNFEYVLEKRLTNWYRRSTLYGAVQAFTDAYTQISTT